MRKILGEAFAEKCRALLKVDGADMYSVARKLDCSYSTVYRATGGKRRTLGLPKKKLDEFSEAVRMARTTSTQGKRNVGTSKAAQRKAHGRKRGQQRVSSIVTRMKTAKATAKVRAKSEKKAREARVAAKREALRAS